MCVCVRERGCRVDGGFRPPPFRKTKRVSGTLTLLPELDIRMLKRSEGEAKKVAPVRGSDSFGLGPVL